MILITCANGKLGERVVRNLLDRADAPAIQVGARSVERIDARLASRCAAVTADYDVPASLAAACEGIKTLVFISGNAGNAVRIPQHHAVIEAAKDAGVERIVYTSFSNPVATSRFKLVQAHVETERALAESGIACTILRNGIFASNLEGFVGNALKSGVLAMPSAAAKICYSGHDDLAEATARVALEAGHAGQTYELTGSEPLDAGDLAALLSEVAGRPIISADIPLGDFRAFLGTLGLDDAAAADLASIYSAAAAGEYATPHDDLARLLGRPPIAMRDYLAALTSTEG